jgi:rhamnosyltransferase
MSKSCGIIVCYQPNVARLRELCDCVLSDGTAVILVDNTEKAYLAPQALPAGCTLITLGDNLGIAHAQNVGAAAALEAGASSLIFFDQDSRIEPGFVTSLLASLREGELEVVAPLCLDETTNVPLPALRVSRHGWSTPMRASDFTDRVPVDVVISSGFAATRRVFEVVGNKDEDLFIDFVDTEWCLRCRARQVPIYVVPTAVMRHSIGIRHFRLGGFTISLHSAARCYYQIRNSFQLFRKPHIPFIFALRQLVATLFNRAVLLLFIRDRRSYLKSYLFAVRDGLKGVTGARSA